MNNLNIEDFNELLKRAPFGKVVVLVTTPLFVRLIFFLFCLFVRLIYAMTQTETWGKNSEKQTYFFLFLEQIPTLLNGFWQQVR